MAMRHGDALARKIRLVTPLLRQVTDRFWARDDLNVLFPAFLQTIYGSVRATQPLMTMAIHESRTSWSGEAVASSLVPYLERHIAEEHEHDEWLLADLESLGVRRADVVSRPAPPAIAAAVGAQYYWMQHAHPCALLGYFAVLEGHPPTIEHLDEIQARTGLPATAFRMLRHHAELDAVHAADLFAFVDGLPLEPWQATLIGTSALHTLTALQSMFDALTPTTPAVPAGAGPALNG